MKSRKIRELARNVGTVVDEMGRRDCILFTKTELDNFVALIIKQCVYAIDDGNGSMSSICEHATRQACMKEIKEHFGVDQ